MKIKNRAGYLQLFRGKLSHKELFELDFAYDLTKYAHQYLEQMRDSGGRYFEHPREVSVIIAQEVGIFDLATHLVALFHDGPEDTHLLGFDRIAFVFGKRAAENVLAVTKQNFEKLPKEKYLESYFKGIVKTGWRAALVKCSDRIHNLRSLPHATEEDLAKVKRQIAETESKFPQLIPVIAKHNKDVAEKVEGLLAKEIKRLKKLLVK